MGRCKNIGLDSHACASRHVSFYEIAFCIAAAHCTPLKGRASLSLDIANRLAMSCLVSQDETLSNRPLQIMPGIKHFCCPVRHIRVQFCGDSQQRSSQLVT